MKGKTIIVRSNLIPNGVCVNIFGTLWARKNLKINTYVVNHEKIHTAQMLELLVIPFYIIYVIEWLIRFCQYRNQHQAYRNISFEREAYSNDSNLNYLSGRSCFSWIKYIRRSQP
ncbi:MAG: hypothetical protein J1E84_05955 [Muribaculaceae bacterium]|nr:hypothetical protein [Muribaculaceae bacterium]